MFFPVIQWGITKIKYLRVKIREDYKIKHACRITITSRLKGKTQGEKLNKILNKVFSP